MTSSAEFTDPRLVAAYDTLNVYEPDTQPDFYLELAREGRASTVIEVGSGTGLVLTHLALAGIDVIGLEPAERMLERARRVPEATGSTGSSATSPSSLPTAPTWRSWPATSRSSSSPTPTRMTP